MGVTIHYAIRSSTKNPHRARSYVEQMRELARDLPFERVGDIRALEGDECDFEKQRGQCDDSPSWLLVQSGQYVTCPWNSTLSRSIAPTQVIALETIPGPGCEPANLGLCQYPRETDWEYRPQDDARFEEEYHPSGPASTSRRFSWKKWVCWLRRHGRRGDLHPGDEQFAEIRRVKTCLSGWRWSSFCKTQYASDPRCGGPANFLRCHISVVTLLDRIAKLPTLKVHLDDEGRYGPSRYSDDWQIALAEGRQPTYAWHAGQYRPQSLAAEVGEWNDMLATFAGAMKEATKGSDLSIRSPIFEFPTFESLEFRGAQNERLQPFLQLMRHVAESQQRKAAHKL